MNEPRVEIHNRSDVRVCVCACVCMFLVYDVLTVCSNKLAGPLSCLRVFIKNTTPFVFATFVWNVSMLLRFTPLKSFLPVFTSVSPLLVERSRLRSDLCRTGVGGRGFSGLPEVCVSSGRGRDLYPEQLVSENVPEDGEEEEGDEGEDEDPPGALFMQRFLIATQDQQPHADAHHCTRQMSHETGLRSGGGEGRGETQPYGTAHL